MSVAFLLISSTEISDRSTTRTNRIGQPENHGSVLVETMKLSGLEIIYMANNDGVLYLVVTVPWLSVVY